MNKYFELRENGNVLFGVVENIPEDVTHEQVKERIETKDEFSSIELIDGIVEDPEVFFDWTVIDSEQIIEN